MKYDSQIKIIGTLLLIGIMSTGCSFNASKYGASEDNIKQIKNMDIKINVSQFTSSQPNLTSISCRAVGTVESPDGVPFETYIQNSFISELTIAGKYDPESRITINGHLDEIDFDSNIGTANWKFILKVTSNNSKSIVVNTTHEFPGSFIAGMACQGVAQEFVPAVQHLIKDIITHPDFYTLYKT